MEKETAILGFFLYFDLFPYPTNWHWASRFISRGTDDLKCFVNWHEELNVGKKFSSHNILFIYRMTATAWSERTSLNDF